MKKYLIIFVLMVTPINAVIFTRRTGCGTFMAVPLLVGLQIVSSCCGERFADNHPYITAAAGSFVGACFVAALLTVIAAVLRKRGWLTSPFGLAVLFVVVAILYVALGFLNYPQGPCL
jgi:hypothetical protein